VELHGQHCTSLIQPGDNCDHANRRSPPSLNNGNCAAAPILGRSVTPTRSDPLVQILFGRRFGLTHSENSDGAL
jgi:hypothetical protein